MRDHESARIDLAGAEPLGLERRPDLRRLSEISERPAHVLHQGVEDRAPAGAGKADIDPIVVDEILNAGDVGILGSNDREGLRHDREQGA